MIETREAIDHGEFIAMTEKEPAIQTTKQALYQLRPLPSR